MNEDQSTSQTIVNAMLICFVLCESIFGNYILNSLTTMKSCNQLATAHVRSRTAPFAVYGLPVRPVKLRGPVRRGRLVKLAERHKVKLKDALNSLLGITERFALIANHGVAAHLPHRNVREEFLDPDEPSEIIRHVTGPPEFTDRHGIEEWNMPRLQKVLIQSAVKVRCSFLSAQHFKDSSKVSLRRGEKIIVLHDPAGLDRIEQPLTAFGEWHLTPSAFLGASASRDRAAIFQEHAGGKLPARIVVSWPSYSHVFVMSAPRISDLLGSAPPPCESHTHHHRGVRRTRSHPFKREIANESPLIIRRPFCSIGENSNHVLHVSPSSACGASVVSTLADNSEPHRQSRPVPLAAVSSCGQPFVSQPLSADGSNHAVQPLGCVVLYVALIQPPCKFIGIAANMLGADVVEGSINSPLENGPNRFDAVSGSDSTRVLASGMIDGFMLEKQAVKIREHNAIIGIELRPKFDVVVNLGCDGLHGAFIHRGKDGATVTFAHSKHGGFADSTTASFQLFVLMLVPFLAADETLVKFHDALQLCELWASASLTYPMENEPCALLRDADLLRRLHRTDALTSSNEQVHGIEPLVQRDMGTLKDGSRSDGEINLTGIAAIEATLAGSHSLASLASWTDSTIGPKPRFQIDPCGLRIGKHLKQLERADCAFTHALNVLDSLTQVKGVKYIIPLFLTDIATPS